MILNGNASTHDIYQLRRRAAKRKPPARPQARIDGRLAGLNCTLEEKCAWMKEKQARKKLRDAAKAGGKA